MASSVTLPTFYDEEILLYEKLNAFRDAVDAKFAAGVGAADLAWPLIAEGDLNMDGNDILNVGRINNIVSAETYDDLTAVIAATLPGDVVLVPPDTTLAADSGDSFAGNGMSIVGAGPSSVIKFTGTPSGGWMIRSASGGGMRFANMTLDGDSVAGGGTGQIGLDMTGVTNLTIESINFKNFSGPALKVSSTSSGVKVSNCAFNGGDAEHILVEKSDAIEIVNCTSDDAGTTAISFASSGATAYIDAMLSNVHVSSFGTSGIKAEGVAAVASASPVTIQANGVVVDGAGSADSVILGSSGDALEYVSWNGGQINSSGAHGMTVNARGGSITGVEIDSPTTIGIDLDTSRYVHVHDNIIRSATVGIDGSGCTVMCVVHSNSFDSCTANITDGEFLHHYNNEGVVGVSGPMGYSLTGGRPSSAYDWLDNPIAVLTQTIPAYTFQVGDVLKVKLVLYVSIAASGDFNADGVYIQLNGETIGSYVPGATDGNDKYNIETELMFSTSAGGYTFETAGGGGNGTIHSNRTVTGLDITTDMDLTAFNNLDDVSTTGTVYIMYWGYEIQRRTT